MSRIIRSFTSKPEVLPSGHVLRDTFTSEAYSDDGGRTWRWCSNDNPVPVDCLDKYGIPADPQAQRELNDQHFADFAAKYRKRMENHRYSDEELCEMRAAFGRGTTVVNVLTGKKTRL